MTLIQEQIKNNKQEEKAQVYSVSREQLLLTAVTVATTNNEKLKNKLIVPVSKQLGKIDEKDYMYMSEYIFRLPREQSTDINVFLGKHLQNYNREHSNHYALLYML